MEFFKERLSAAAAAVRTYAFGLGKWLFIAVITGVLCGLIGTAFHLAVEYATELRGAHPWLLWCLPAAGLVIVALYKLTQVEGLGTNNIIQTVQHGNRISIWLLPAIFVSTVLTHLTGGSAGREGAALQMGGDIGWHVGSFFKLPDHERRTATMCGMAAFFSALFGTPLAAALFAMMVIRVGEVFYATFVPCLAASLTAFGISLALGVSPTRFAVAVPAVTPALIAKAALFAVPCALVVLIFCWILHFTEHKLRFWIRNPWLRVLAGAAVVIVLTLLVRNTRYNGAGMSVITAAVEQGEALPADWILKILFTSVTLAAGFKGGEVVPCFFIGSTFGCVLAPLLGIPAGFGASLGLVAVFCGAANCPIASIILAIELFGADGMLCYAVVCCICYTLSGYAGLYSSQEMLTSKIAAEYLKKR